MTRDEAIRLKPGTVCVTHTVPPQRVKVRAVGSAGGILCQPCKGAGEPRFRGTRAFRPEELEVES